MPLVSCQVYQSMVFYSKVKGRYCSMADEQWLTVQKIAKRLDVHEQTVRRWLRAGELRGVLLGDKAGYRVREEDFQAFLRSRLVGDGDQLAGKVPRLDEP